MAGGPNYEKLAARLGAPLGETLTELVRVAYASAPNDPAGAFWRLELYLDWIHPETSETADAVLRVPGMTPKDVLPFAATSTDTDHFCLLMRDPGLSTDKRPVVSVSHGGSPQIVAADLRAFLGLVAYAGAGRIRREVTDPEWGAQRAHLLARPDGKEFERASTLLLGIPGVTLPASPYQVAHAAPDLAG